MEHRYSQRIDVDLKATIYKRGLALGTGRIKNGSKHGLYLETPIEDINLLQKLVLEVVVHPGPQSSRRYQFNTIVVRKSYEGIGLELETLDDEDSAQMAELLTLSQANDQRHSRTGHVPLVKHG